jgi:DNA (cytosine-5)-methyltransferase 1
MNNKDIVVHNPLKGKTKYGWHFEQNVYDVNGITRAIKAGGGSGNIPKIIEIIYEQSGNILE